MVSEATQNPDIPESAVEHVVEYTSHWVDRWTVPNPFISVLWEVLRPIGVTLEDYGFKQDAKNVSETALIVSVKSLNAVITVGVDRLTFRVFNPDWEMAPALVPLFDDVISAITSFVSISVKRQEITLALHVTSGAVDFKKTTGLLVNERLLGDSAFYGVTLTRSDSSLEIARSLKFHGGAFLRMTREFGPSTVFTDIAFALYSDEVAALKLIGVENVI
jgi:hypothetical protein